MMMEREIGGWRIEEGLETSVVRVSNPSMVCWEFEDPYDRDAVGVYHRAQCQQPSKQFLKDCGLLGPNQPILVNCGRDPSNMMAQFLVSIKIPREKLRRFSKSLFL